MALESPSTPDRPRPRRHLEAVEQLPRRGTVYTSPARARVVLRRMIVSAILLVTFALAWTFGYDLLRVLGIAFLVLVAIALGTLAVILAVDVVRGQR